MTGKPLYHFACERKEQKCISNTNSGLSLNCAEKQIMPSKTTVNWLFNDILCYLFITSFDWKIGVFQQTVVSVSSNLKFEYRTCSLSQAFLSFFFLFKNLSIIIFCQNSFFILRKFTMKEEYQLSKHSIFEY